MITSAQQPKKITRVSCVQRATARIKQKFWMLTATQLSEELLYVFFVHLDAKQSKGTLRLVLRKRLQIHKNKKLIGGSQERCESFQNCASMTQYISLAAL